MSIKKRNKKLNQGLLNMAAIIRTTGWLLLTGCTFATEQNDLLEVRIIAFNDFHGALEADSQGRGGAAVFSSLVQQSKSQRKHSIVVAAGDLVGASPLVSSLFHDEPTIELMNQIGLDYTALGNHELDEGASEIMRLLQGGSHPIDGDRDGDGFNGAEFQMLAANLFSDEKPLLPPYAIRVIEGVPVAFIGIILESAPSLVSASAVVGLTFSDEAEIINQQVAELRAQGVEAIVVLIHEGGIPQSGGLDDCEGFSGDIINVVKRSDEAVDLFVTGHTHRYYVCDIDGRTVTSAGSNGRWFTEIDVSIDRNTRDVSRVVAHNQLVRVEEQPSGFMPDAEVAEAVARYKKFARPLTESVVGQSEIRFTAMQNQNGESALGNLIADAQLAATNDPGAFELPAQLAMMNPGGIRAELPVGDVTYGDLFSIQPFENTLVTLSLTGLQIAALLEAQWQEGGGGNRILSVSEGFSYQWDPNAPVGSRIALDSVWLNGTALQPHSSYRVTVNSFIAGGGDGFVVFPQGKNRVLSAVDVDVLQSYLKVHSPLGGVKLDRISRRLDQ